MSVSCSKTSQLAALALILLLASSFVLGQQDNKASDQAQRNLARGGNDGNKGPRNDLLRGRCVEARGECTGSSQCCQDGETELVCLKNLFSEGPDFYCANCRDRCARFFGARNCHRLVCTTDIFNSTCEEGFVANQVTLPGNRNFTECLSPVDLEELDMDRFLFDDDFVPPDDDIIFGAGENAMRVQDRGENGVARGRCVNAGDECENTSECCQDGETGLVCFESGSFIGPGFVCGDCKFVCGRFFQTRNCDQLICSPDILNSTCQEGFTASQIVLFGTALTECLSPTDLPLPMDDDDFVEVAPDDEEEGNNGVMRGEEKGQGRTGPPPGRCIDAGDECTDTSECCQDGAVELTCFDSGSERVCGDCIDQCNSFPLAQNCDQLNCAPSNLDSFCQPGYLTFPVPFSDPLYRECIPEYHGIICPLEFDQCFDCVSLCGINGGENCDQLICTSDISRSLCARGFEPRTIASDDPDPIFLYTECPSEF